MKENKQEWLKIDMHMHSQYSKKYDPHRVKDMSAKDYVDTLMQNGIKIFSITDHNTFSSKYYREIRNYIKDLPIKIINGAELEVYIDDKNSIHMGVYFPDNIDAEKLEKCINNLYNNSKPKFSELLHGLSTLNSKFILIPEGDKSKGVTRIVTKLNDDDKKCIEKYAMYKVFSAFDVRENFDQVSKEKWAEGFYQNSKDFDQLMEGKTDDEINEILLAIQLKIKDSKYEFKNELEKKIYEYIVKYGNYFAYFSFSDWHNAEPYNPTTNNYIFGSLDLPYESFELSVLDPISRVIKGKEKSIPIPPNILSQISFKMNNKDVTVNLSPGLNAIIGKRGSGKSLLLSIIEKLNQKNSESLDKYTNFNISAINGIDYNNIKISEGELSSVAILKQDTIERIYEDPNLAVDEIGKKFLEIESFDTTPIDNVIEILKGLEPYDNNYKSVTSIIKMLKKQDYYNFDKLDEIDEEKITHIFDEINKKYDQLILQINKLGIDTAELEVAKQQSKNISLSYIKQINLYKEIIANNNIRIQKVMNMKDSAQKVIIEQRKNLKEIVLQVKNNFNSLLEFNKLKYLIDHMYFKNIEIKKRKIDNYMFITSYEVPDNLKDIVLDKILNTISKVKGDTQDLDLIYKYICGGKKLKTDYKNLYDDLLKYSNESIFEPVKKFYKIPVDLDINAINSKNDIDKLVNDGTIKDLSKASPGMKSVAYLDLLFGSDKSILLFDQPEDNIDNYYISNTLVDLIKEKKKTKQLIFVTHNPSLAVYGDAFNYIYVTSEEKDGIQNISYNNYLIEKNDDKDKIMDILEGGKKSFVNRDRKYGNVLGEIEYGDN